MAFTQDQLDSIDEAIASGTLKVKYADKEVTYRSLEDLLSTKAFMEKSMCATPKKASYVISALKGFNSSTD